MEKNKEEEEEGNQKARGWLKLSRGWYYWLAIPLALFILALISRVYDLSIFPFFNPGSPTCGGLPDCSGAYPSLPGLYDDEVANVLATSSIRSIVSNFGGGPIASLLILASTRILGLSVFAVRLPFALISSITAVLVYFTTKMITNSRSLGILSASYFIIMMPALVYGRMALGENVVALFFIITVYATLRIRSSAGTSKQWFLLAALIAALGTIVKLEGIILILYFVVFAYRAKLLRKATPYIGISVTFGALLPLGFLQLMTGNAIGLVIQKAYPFVSEMGNELAMYRFFFFDTIPTGFVVTWNGFFVPDFWYIFLYAALFALIVYSYKEFSELFLALGLFVGFFMTFSAPFGSYWMILIQPLLAVAFGPGLKRLLKMPLVATLAFYAFLFVPVATSIGEYLITPKQVGNIVIMNQALFIWNLGTAVPLFLLLFLTARANTRSSRLRPWINGAVIAAFFVALLVATFLLPDLYPYYIKGIL